MAQLIFEFQNLKPPKDFDRDIDKILHGENVNHRTRKVMGLGGVETLVIAIVGQISATLLLRLSDYIYQRVAKQFEILLQDTGKKYQLPKDRNQIESIDGK